VAVSQVHVVVAELREIISSLADVAAVQTTAARFRGDLAKILADSSESRRLIHEGDLSKVAASGTGKHSLYRFFLFNDMLVYAQKGAFGGKWNAHNKIPLRGMRITMDPSELLASGVASGLGFRLDTAVKPLFVYCNSDDDCTVWRRQIREAVAAAEAQEDQDALLASTIAAASQSSQASALEAKPLSKSSSMGELRRKSSMSRSDSSTGNATSVVAAAPALRKLSSAAPEATTPRSEAKTEVRKSSTDSPASFDSPKPVTPSLSTSDAAPAASSATSTSAAGPAAATRPELTNSIAELKAIFLQAVGFCRPLLVSDSGTENAAHASLRDADKLAFYAYFKQATSGDCPSPSSDDDISMIVSTPPTPPSPNAGSSQSLSIANTKRDAWRRCVGMRRRDAMRAFVMLLDRSVPTWQASASPVLESATGGDSLASFGHV
jgi:acyl-CoA-binding protein